MPSRTAAVLEAYVSHCWPMPIWGPSASNPTRVWLPVSYEGHCSFPGSWYIQFVCAFLSISGGMRPPSCYNLPLDRGASFVGINILHWWWMFNSKLWFWCSCLEISADPSTPQSALIHGRRTKSFVCLATLSIKKKIGGKQCIKDFASFSWQ